MVKPPLMGTKQFSSRDVAPLRLIVGMDMIVNLKFFTGMNDDNILDNSHTAVEPITFRAVCQTIAKYAFVTSDLPVIISLEVHCSIEQQKKMVEVIFLLYFHAK